MNFVCDPERIRTLIRETLVSLGAEANAKDEESLLIRSGAYCGHRIDKDGLRAIWFIEEDQIKFYGRDGSMLRALVPSDVFSQKAA
jgi:ATP-dependent DNA ligase